MRDEFSGRRWFRRGRRGTGEGGGKADGRGYIQTRPPLERDTVKLDYGLLSVSIPSGLHLRSPPPSLVRPVSPSTVKLISEDERSDAVDPLARPSRPSPSLSLRFLLSSISLVRSLSLFPFISRRHNTE